MNAMFLTMMNSLMGVMNVMTKENGAMFAENIIVILAIIIITIKENVLETYVRMMKAKKIFT